jgi:hypothetical protein
MPRRAIDAHAAAAAAADAFDTTPLFSLTLCAAAFRHRRFSPHCCLRHTPCRCSLKRRFRHRARRHCQLCRCCPPFATPPSDAAAMPLAMLFFDSAARGAARKRCGAQKRAYFSCLSYYADAFAAFAFAAITLSPADAIRHHYARHLLHIPADFDFVSLPPLAFSARMMLPSAFHAAD